MSLRLSLIVGTVVLCAALVSVSSLGSRPRAQQTRGSGLDVRDYEPRSTLIVDSNPVPRAKFPVIDVHSHHRPGFSTEEWSEIVNAMDGLNLQVLVNLSGGSGATIVRGVNTIQQSDHPERMVFFSNLDFRGGVKPGFGERAAARLERDVAAGAVGLKFFKNFGIDVRDENGVRVAVDDPELDPVFEVAGQLGVPVLMHVGEPLSFYEPVDQYNERWLELTLLPRRRLPADQYPGFETMMEERNRRFARHPGTNFIAAHMGWHANDLGRLGRLLDRMPNVYVETGAILYELGRQPWTAREFFESYQDRILFGKDSFAPDEFPHYWRTFETRDEYFDYYRGYHAFWQMYGMDLPDEVLKKVYYRNALKLISGIDSRQFPAS